MKAAPFAFVTIFVAGLAIGATGGLAWRAQEVANAEMLVRAVEAQKALSDQQLNNIRSSLQDAQPSAVDILGGGKKAEQLKNAFSDSGWQVQVEKGKDPVNDLILRAQNEKAADAIQRALKDAGVNYQAIVPLGNGGTDFLLGPSGNGK